MKRIVFKTESRMVTPQAVEIKKAYSMSKRKGETIQSLIVNGDSDIEIHYGIDTISDANEDTLAGFLSEKDDIESSMNEKELLETIEKNGGGLIVDVQNILGSILVCEFEENNLEYVKKGIEEKNKKDISSKVKGVLKLKLQDSTGTLTKKALEERLKYMYNNDLTDIQIQSILDSYRRYPTEIAKKIANPTTKFVDSKGILKKSIGYANIKRNLLFEGERGVGKNVLTETLSWLYMRPLYEFSMNAQLDNSAVLGSRTFKAHNARTESEQRKFLENVSELFKKVTSPKNLFSSWFKSDDEKEMEQNIETIKELSNYLMNEKEIEFEPSTIIESALYGGILVLDEVNQALGYTLSILNSLLDSRRRINVEGFQDVVADDNFFAIATMNKDYQAVFELNEAFDDRFEKIIFPPLTSIKGILRGKVKGISKDTLNKCDRVFKAIQKGVQEGHIEARSLTIRGFISASMVIDQGLDLREALISSVAHKAQDTDERMAIESIISDMF